MQFQPTSASTEVFYFGGAGASTTDSTPTPLLIDEFRVYSSDTRFDGCLTAEEIRRGYVQNVWPSTRLQIHWSFDEQRGSTIIDRSGWGRHCVGCLAEGGPASWQTTQQALSKCPPPPAFANLSLSHGDSGEEITLEPPFSPAVLHYTAAVANIIGGVAVRVSFDSSRTSVRVQGPIESAAAPPQWLSTSSSGSTVRIQLPMESGRHVVRVQSQSDGSVYTVALSVSGLPCPPGNVVDSAHLHVEGANSPYATSPIIALQGRDFTFCLWSRAIVPDQTTPQTIVSFGTRAAANNLVKFGYDKDPPRKLRISWLGLHDRSLDVLLSGDVNKWVYYCVATGQAAQHEGQSVHDTWRNGALIERYRRAGNEAVNYYPLGGAQEITFGRMHRASNAEIFRGDVDEFRLWSVMLTNGEVARGYSQGVFPLASLEVYWPFTEKQGSDVMDYSGKERHFYNAIQGALTRGSTAVADSKCVARPPVVNLRSLQLSLSNNAPIHLSPAFNSTTTSYTASVSMAPRSAVPESAVPAFASSCTLAPVWPLLPLFGESGPAAGHLCQSVPVGSNCSFTCAAGYVLAGGPLTCQANGELSGQQLCRRLPTFEYINAAATLSADSVLGGGRRLHGMAYCAGSETLYIAGGNRGGDPATGAALYESIDGGLSFRVRGALTGMNGGSGEGSVALLCDGRDRLHLFGPTPRDLQWQPASATWTAAVTNPSALCGSRVAAVLIPRSPASSDYLVLGGTSGSVPSAQVHRFDSTQRQWSLVCGAAPWGPRHSALAAYADERTLLMMHGITSAGGADAVAQDVWRSVDDGATWSLVAGPPARPASIPGHYGGIAVGYAGTVIVGFGSSRLGVELSDHFLQQSADQGRTWIDWTMDDSGISDSSSVSSDETLQPFASVALMGSRMVVYGGGNLMSVRDSLGTISVGLVEGIRFSPQLSLTPSLRLGVLYNYAAAPVSFTTIGITMRFAENTRCSVQLNGGDVRALQSGVRFVLTLRTGGNTLRLNTPDGLYTFSLPVSKPACSLDSSAVSGAVVGSTACSAVPLGGNCTLPCQAGFLLRGEAQQCVSLPGGGVQMPVRQQCVSASSNDWVSVSGDAQGALFSGGGLAYCETSGMKWLLGLSSGGSFSAASVYQRADLSSWVAGPDLGTRLNAVPLCTPEGVVYAVGGAASTHGLTYLYDHTPDSAWLGPFSHGSAPARYFHASALVPSSGRRDVLTVGGSSPDGSVFYGEVLRFSARTKQWSTVCSAAPWVGRRRHAIAYVGRQLVLTGGESATHVLGDTWRSSDDGASWHLLAAASAWSPRLGHALFSSGGMLTLAFGRSTLTTAGTSAGLGDMHQSADGGRTWTQASGGVAVGSRWNTANTVARDQLLVCGGNQNVAERAGSFKDCARQFIGTRGASPVCSLTAPPANLLAFPTNCGSVVYGANCTFHVPADDSGLVQVGQRYACGLNGQLSGQQAALPLEWHPAGVIGARGRPALVFNPRTQRTYLIGGVTNGSSNAVPSSSLVADGPIGAATVWLPWGTAAIQRVGATALVDGLGRLHLLFGDNKSDSIIVSDDGDIESGPYAAGSIVRANGRAIIIPHTGRMDFLQVGGFGSSVVSKSIWRWWGQKLLWTEVTPAANLPVDAVQGFALHYHSDSYVIVGGVAASNVFSSDVLSSPGPGVNNSWSTASTSIVPRANFVSGQVGATILLAAGRTGTSIENVDTSMYQISLSTAPVTVRRVAESSNIGTRVYAASAVVQGKLLACGGITKATTSWADSTRWRYDCMSLQMAALSSLRITPALTTAPWIHLAETFNYSLSLQGLTVDPVFTVDFQFGDVTAELWSPVSGISAEPIVFTSGVGQRVPLHVGDVLTLHTPDGDYTFRAIDAICSTTPVAPMSGRYNCLNVPVGASCSFECPTGQQVIGAPLQCQVDGTFTGSQSCLSVSSWAQLSDVSIPGTPDDGVMAWCPSTDRLYYGLGGMGATQLKYSDDGGRSWQIHPATLSNMDDTYGVCDAQGTLHVIGSSLHTNGYRLLANATEFSGPIPLPAEVGSLFCRTTAVTIPSSGDLDFLECGARDPLRNMCLRWFHKQASYQVVCAAAPWAARRNMQLDYVGNTLVLLAGTVGKSGEPNFDDVWQSPDDGASWTLVYGGSTGTNLPGVGWEGRQLGLMFAYGHHLVHGLGRKVFGAAPSADMWQSSDAGQSWKRLADAPTAITPLQRYSSRIAVYHNKGIVCGGSAGSGDVMLQNTCFALTLGVITNFTFAGVEGMSPPLQPGRRFQYSATLGVPTASFTVQFLSGHVSYVWNGEQRRHVGSGMPVSLLPLTRRRANVLTLHTPDGTHTFQLTATDAAMTTSAVDYRVHAHFTGGVADATSPSLLVRGLTPYGARSEWQPVGQSGVSTSHRWSSTPGVNRVQVLSPHDATKYEIAVTTTTTPAPASGSSNSGSSTCAPGTVNTGHVRLGTPAGRVTLRPNVALTGDFTVCTWAFMDAWDASYSNMYIWSLSDGTKALGMQYENLGLTMYLSTMGSEYYTPHLPADVPNLQDVGRWTHLCGQLRSYSLHPLDPQMIMYRNGRLHQAIGTLAPSALQWTGSASDSLLMGLHYTGASGLKGALDEVRVWTRLLSGDEVAAAYSLNRHSSAGLVVYHSFNAQRGNIYHNFAAGPFAALDVAKPNEPTNGAQFERDVRPLCLPAPPPLSVLLRPVGAGTGTGSGVALELSPAFSPLVSEYTVAVPEGVSGVQLFVSWPPAAEVQLAVAGPTGAGSGASFSAGHSALTPLTSPLQPLNFTLNPTGSPAGDPASSAANVITLRDSLSGNIFTFLLYRPCAQSASGAQATGDDGHLSLLGTGSVELAPGVPLGDPTLGLARNDFTICFWMLALQASGVSGQAAPLGVPGAAGDGMQSVLLQLGEGTGSSRSMQLLLTEQGQLRLAIVSGTTLESNEPLSDSLLSRWHHVCLSLGSATVHADFPSFNLFLDGGIVQGVAGGDYDWTPDASADARKVWLGGVGPLSSATPNAAGVARGAFHGRIDELRIYRTSSLGVAAAYLENSWPTGTALYAYYPFSGEDGGTTCYDHSGNGRHWSNCRQTGISEHESGDRLPLCLQNRGTALCRNVVDGC